MGKCGVSWESKPGSVAIWLHRSGKEVLIGPAYGSYLLGLTASPCVSFTITLTAVHCITQKEQGLTFQTPPKAIVKASSQPLDVVGKLSTA